MILLSIRIKRQSIENHFYLAVSNRSYKTFEHVPGKVFFLCVKGTLPFEFNLF